VKETIVRLWRRVAATWGRVLGPEGAADAAPDADMLAGQFTHQGRSTDYRLYVPPGGAWRARPLVLMLHGCQQDPLDFALGTQMNKHARAHGVLVLYPAQSDRANPQRCWNWFKPQHQHRARGEPALLAALVREVMAQQAVDPARVYVAGLSAGGAMADVMAQTHPDLFAAVGIHAGVMAGAAHSVMAALSVMQNGPTLPLAMSMVGGPRMRVPAIVFQGDADSTVHWRNAERIVLAALGGDDSGMSQTQGEAPGGRRFTRTCYAARAVTRADVEYWLVHDSGHAWSGGSAVGSYTDPAGPDASAQMLRFFLAHPAPVSAHGSFPVPAAVSAAT